MKRTLGLSTLIVMLLGACILPGIPIQSAAPTVDVAGTADTVMKTAVAQTLAAQPTVMAASPTDTLTPVLETPLPEVTDSPTPTETPFVNLTTTVDTATLGTVDLAPTATLAVIPGTSIATLTIRTYGTLPPEVPFSNITLINKAKTQAYISLQVTSPDGRYAILEYPVEGKVKIKAPIGYYLYVAWVGGNKMVGNFRLHGNEDLSITLLRDEVIVK